MIYLDNSATTKPLEQTVEAINIALTKNWGNPSSKHIMGGNAHTIIEQSRKEIMTSLGIRRNNECGVIFTSGGTESNNLAIFGSVYAKERPFKNGSRGKIIISDGEHSSIDKCALRLEKEGFTILRIPTIGGHLDLEYLKSVADSTTILLSVMLVNNETGAIYDVKEAAGIVRSANPRAFIHCDAVQGYLKLPFSFKSLCVDALTISSHKVYSPKGSGALIITPDVIKGRRLDPHIYGGGQEDNYRSGTENVPSIYAFGIAAKIGTEALQGRIAVTNNLRNKILSGLPKEVTINLPENPISNIINITLPQIKSETMLNYLSSKEICVSSGSACSSHSNAVSHALTAFGLDKNQADCSIRISLSHENTEEEISTFLKVLEDGIKTLQRIKK